MTDYENRRNPTRKAIKEAFSLAGGRCSFPGCQTVTLDNGLPLVEIAHISSSHPRGMRYDPEMQPGSEKELGNLIILCPTHHSLVDRMPGVYDTPHLAAMRQLHIDQLSRTSEADSVAATTSRLDKALDIWKGERGNRREEFWQSFFSERPEALAVTLEGRAYTLLSKCYVGGKSVTNSGGNLLDFMAQHNGNVALLEIKTPATKLLSHSKYRENVYAPSRELAGACVQVLEYRHSLMSNLPILSYGTPGLRAAHPVAIVIAGDVEAELTSENHRRSFELFRASLRDVRIITYDEIFAGISMLAAALSD